MGMSSSLMDKIRAKRKDIQQRTGQREDVLRIPMGKHKFRILPAKPERGADAEFWADFGQHFIKSEEKNERGNNKTKAVYVCTDKTFGRPCPICETIESLIPSAVDDEQIEILDESKCRRAEVLLNVLHLTGDKKETPQILQMTPSTFETILGLMDEYGDITNLAEGTDIIIERTGAGLNTRYTVMPAARSKPVSEHVLEQMADLQDYVQQEHEEGLKRAIVALNETVGLLDAPMTPAIADKSKSTKPRTVEDDMSEIMEAEFEETTERTTVKSTVSHSADDSTVSSDKVDAPDELGGLDELDELDSLLADLDEVI